MPKDTKKYRYIEAALLRGSSTLTSLEQDAADHHMSGQLGKMAALRLADYYKVAERLGTYSLEGILAALPAMARVAPISSLGATNGNRMQTTPRLDDDHENVMVEPSTNLQENAVAASDYWNHL